MQNPGRKDLNLILIKKEEALFIDSLFYIIVLLNSFSLTLSFIRF